MDNFWYWLGLHTIFRHHREEAAQRRAHRTQNQTRNHHYGYTRQQQSDTYDDPMDTLLNFMIFKSLFDNDRD